MLTVTGLWFDHERAPVGLDHTPVFGWQLEGNWQPSGKPSL